MVKRVTATGPVEGPWALPDGWRWKRLGAILPLSYGKALTSTERLGGDVPVYGSAGITGFHNVALCQEPALIVGRKGSAGAVYHADGPSYAIDTAYFCSATSSDIDLRLGYYLLTHVDLRKLDQSTAVPSLSRDPYNELIVPVPPDDVQPLLSARIDELFAEIDDGEAALAQARDDLATWRKALLKAAVTGDLTADWRTANPAAETGADLLARILAQRRASWEAEPGNRGKRYKEPRPVAIDDGRDLPDGWTWASVDQIGEVVTGNTPPASDLAAYNGEVPFFTPGDLDAGFALDATKRTLGPSGLAKSRPVPPRSVLVTCIGATIGKVGFNARAGATNQQINTIIPVVDDLAECIFHYFDGPGRHLVIDGASSTTMPIINKGDFSRLPVPIPPLEEAREIIRVIAARYADAIAAGEDMKDARLAAVVLRQSILAAAFRGELA